MVKTNEAVRVLIINDHLGYSGGAIHGGTTLFYSMLTGFDQEHVDGQLCILGDRHPAAQMFHDAGINLSFLERKKWDPLALQDLVRLVRKRDIDILHVNTMKAFLLGRVVARITGCRVIVHFHDTLRPGPVLGTLQRLLVPWTDLALAVSAHVKDMAVETYAIPEDRIHVLPNGVDLKRFSALDPEVSKHLREEWGMSEATPVVGVIGRMVEGKGQDILLRGLPPLFQKYPDTKVIFVGDGPTRHRCEILASELRIDSNVVFKGHRDDIPAVLAATDVVALPSVLEEGFHIAVLETMAAGKAVIAFDAGANADIIGHMENGLLVPKGNIESFVDALALLIQDKELREQLGVAGNTRAKEYDISGYVSQLENIYHSVMLASD